MTKKELVNFVADKAGIPKKMAEEAVFHTLDAIGGALASGEDVRIFGFGTFSTLDRHARKGRNPQTGEEIDIDARRVVKFKAGKALTEAVNL